MSQHTPGPWHVGAQNDSLYIVNTKPSPAPLDYMNEGNTTTVVIASVNYPPSRTHDALANANLLAAAPDLLAALEEFEQWRAVVAQDYPELLPLFNGGRAAIAKAQGEAS